jgi:hypothetical protein
MNTLHPDWNAVQGFLSISVWLAINRSLPSRLAGVYARQAVADAAVFLTR